MTHTRWPRLARSLTLTISRALILTLVTASVLPAQPDPYDVQELAPGVFAVIRKVPTTGASDSNVLFIINDHDVVVVDANIFPTSARQTIAEIRKRTTKPVRYLVNTHFHSDHHYGNAEYVKAYPGVEIISHPTTRSLIVSEDIPSLEKNVSTEYPAAIARLEKVLASGKASSGKPLTADQRKDVAENIALYQFFLRDVRGMRPMPATLTVADSLVLQRGERRIVIEWLGRGNTPGDLVVHLPRERIVATGDLVVSPTPFGYGSFVADWPATLRRLKALDAATIMPGHGEVMRDWTYVDRLIPMFESIWTQVRAAVAAGSDLDATRKAVDLTAFREAFAGGDEQLRSAFDGNFSAPIIEAAWKQAREDAARPPSRP